MNPSPVSRPIHYKGLREHMEALRAIGELQEIDQEVDWNLEIGAITRRIYETGGPAVLFNRIMGIEPGFRRAARLPAPEAIRQGTEKLGLTQKQFANLLGVGEATVSRWETGAQIQQRAMDRFVRVCLASPAAVELLRSEFQASGRGA